MKTGIILEIDEKYLTLLTPDGQFMRSRNMEHPYQIGQEIQFVPIQESARNPIKWYSTAKGKALAAAAFAIMVGASTFIPIYQSNQVYAYMTIDDGASIELEVNKELEVIGVIPYNDKGENVVKAIDDWEDQNLSDVSEKIITEIEKQEVGDGEIVMSSTFLDNTSNKKVEKKLEQEMTVIQSVVREHKSSVTHVEGTKSERKKAKEQGITIGKLKEKEITKKSKEKQPTNDNTQGTRGQKGKQLTNENQQHKEKKNQKDNQSPANDEAKNNRQNKQKNPRNQDAERNNTDNQQNRQNNHKQIPNQAPKQQRNQEPSWKEQQRQQNQNVNNQDIYQGKQEKEKGNQR
ncbi:anti-sigma factor domain-containing protein [Bacillus marasmi]|uniref:anti-sigma factor domain-containing protein n=1 Tax=Bacillus marasmi TaxID=1926279 RepID=UPI00164EC673|nr:anti-sigma factor domain-containing protein [Bacillus marasmi]